MTTLLHIENKSGAYLMASSYDYNVVFIKNQEICS